MGQGALDGGRHVDAMVRIMKKPSMIFLPAIRKRNLCTPPEPISRVSMGLWRLSAPLCFLTLAQN
jgi:hypothetical protein